MRIRTTATITIGALLLASVGMLAPARSETVKASNDRVIDARIRHFLATHPGYRPGSLAYGYAYGEGAVPGYYGYRPVYGYGYATGTYTTNPGASVEIDGNGVVTARSAATLGGMCTTAVQLCPINEQAWVGGSCLCRDGAGVTSYGRVTP